MNIKNNIKKENNINYTNKDFESLRNDLQRYALTHYSDNIIDFSDASLGGLLLDIGAYVGDVMSYYIDHQFKENSIELAVERNNLERLIRESGLEIPVASPSFVEIDISLIVPSTLVNNVYVPDTNYLPIVKKNSIFSSTDVEFSLLDDVNFSDTNSEGKLIAEYTVGRTINNIPENFIVKRKGLVTSSKIKSEIFNFGSEFIPFNTIILNEENVTEIISVIDLAGDEYYEVDSLSQDSIFKVYNNTDYDVEDVPSRLELMYAGKRYVKFNNYESNKTYLRFGNGNESSFDEDIIPDPSEYAIKLYGNKSSFPKISIDPNNFLSTQTLGISPTNTKLTITYRHGGGLNHNVSAGEIINVKSVLFTFKSSVNFIDANKVKSSIRVINNLNAKGGEDRPSLEDLRINAIFNRSSQNRIVTREDLLARIISLPTQFGKIFKAAVADNPINPRGALLYVISRDKNKKLVISSDTLKKNIAKYLNSFRLVSDAIDILDAKIINFNLNYTVTIDINYRSEIVLSLIDTKLKNYFNNSNNEINKPIVLSEIENIILNIPGVFSLLSLNINNLSGYNDGLMYSNHKFNMTQNVKKGLIFPPLGGIFELKYPETNIIGKTAW